MLSVETPSEIRGGDCRTSGPFRDETADIRQENWVLACNNRTKFPNIEWIELLH